MIICTENDKDFIKYEDKVKNRKTIFTIKQIFKDWWNNFLETYPNLNIRNVVFTIPDELRIYFRQDRKRLNYLFKDASITGNYWTKEKYKKKDIVPAYISILHTFGRSLIFNPHIHMILMESGISNKYKEFIKVDFFSYSSFRKRFMKVLLDMLEQDIGKNEFRKIKNEMYLKHKEGFYVFAPPSKFKSYIYLIKYVCRYVARPVMAESRIIDYDGEFVTFWYQRHNDDLIVIEKFMHLNLFQD